MKIKFHQNRALYVLVALILLSIVPGQGEKVSQDTMSIVKSTYTCHQDSDCPSCVGAGIVKYNGTSSGYFGELSYQKCISGYCHQSDTCMIWACGASQSNCKSIKQTLLDNTITKLNNNPLLYLLIVGLVIAYIIV